MNSGSRRKNRTLASVPGSRAGTHWEAFCNVKSAIFCSLVGLNACDGSAVAIEKQESLGVSLDLYPGYCQN
jgi:hypothetical protein